MKLKSHRLKFHCATTIQRPTLRPCSTVEIRLLLLLLLNSRIHFFSGVVVKLS